MIYQIQGKDFWLDEVVDAFIEYVDQRGIPSDNILTLASGMTPSCPIHFGILREILITHFVAMELIKRGRNVRLIYYWDDFDHFCKIPYYTDEKTVKEYLGKSLRQVPDLEGGYNSYGERYMYQFEAELEKLGVMPRYNYQSKTYAEGRYTQYIRKALAHRREIYDCLNDHRKPYTKENSADRDNYFPLEVYCANCKRDRVRVIEHIPGTDTISYSCQDCGLKGTYTLGADFSGKLMWKANWATRWHHDSVLFESSGENQLTEEGSYSVASKIIERLYASQAPFSLLYRFVGVPGVSKVSRALGPEGLTSKLTGLLEPAIIRWLFIRNPPNKGFSIDMDENLTRLYHEWDDLMQKNAESNASEIEVRLFKIATDGVAYCPFPIPIKTVSLAVSLARGDERQAAEFLSRIKNLNLPLEDFYRSALPRIKCGSYFATRQEDLIFGTFLLEKHDLEIYQSLTSEYQDAAIAVADGLAACNNENEIAGLLKKTAETISDRKEFYRTLYMLLTGKSQGPKLSTLLSLAGAQTIMNLIKGESGYAK